MDERACFGDETYIKMLVCNYLCYLPGVKTLTFAVWIPSKCTYNKIKTKQNSALKILVVALMEKSILMVEGEILQYKRM